MVAELNNGLVPPEIVEADLGHDRWKSRGRRARGLRYEVDLVDRRTEIHTPPPPPRERFSGIGNRLGGSRASTAVGRGESHGSKEINGKNKEVADSGLKDERSESLFQVLLAWLQRIVFWVLGKDALFGMPAKPVTRPHTESVLLTVDESEPVSEIRLNLIGGILKSVRCNPATHTLCNLYAHAAALSEMSSGTTELVGGAPPRRLCCDDTTLEAADLAGSTVRQRPAT